MNHFPIHNSSIRRNHDPPLLPIFSSLPRYLTNAPPSHWSAPSSSSLLLLVGLLPVGLLVGEVVAGLAAILLHASKLIYPSIHLSNVPFETWEKAKMPQIGMDGLWEYFQVIFANLKSIFAFSQWLGKRQKCFRLAWLVFWSNIKPSLVIWKAFLLFLNDLGKGKNASDQHGWSSGAI